MANLKHRVLPWAKTAAPDYEGSPCIVLVEDDLTLADSLTELFHEESFNVTLADDGEQGLKRMLDQRPDLVILDVQLPLRNGLDVLAHFRSIDSDTPVIVVSADPDRRLQKQAIVLGASAFLRKPFHPDVLIQVMRRFLPAA